MSKNNVRVVLPRNPDKLLALAKKIVEKHNSDGASSKLSSINMADMEAKLIDAGKANDNALTFRKKAENETEKRDLQLGISKEQNSSTEGTVLYYTASVRDVLLGLFKGKEQELGEYGFEVNKSPKTKTPPAPQP